MSKIEKISAAEFNRKYGTRFKEIKPKKNKFNAIKTEIGDKKFDSQSEGNLFWELSMQQKAGMIQSVECQAKEELRSYDEPICNYYVDFKVIHNDGVIEFIEHKSQGTVQAAWQIKWKMLKAKYKKEISQGKVKCSINWYKSKTIWRK